MADAETDAGPVDQDALVADIDRTRAELARTIDAISDRVSPKKNARRVSERIRQRVSQIDPVMAGAPPPPPPLTVPGLVQWRAPRGPRGPKRSQAPEQA